ncbi:MAG: efflux transporter outer membrane subunit [Deltaproteobacteria bacterium]|nr:efflux transporter outer membrane subunit [Deltaproteobacteria bacterium]
MLLLLAGCSLFAQSSYVRPDIEIPEQWQTATEENTQRTEKFWESFNDPLLNDLIEKALQVNNDVRAATIKVQRARLEAGLAGTDLLPTPSASADASFSKDLKDGNSSPNFSASAGLSYEIDLWGKYSGSYEAELLEVEATEADRRSAALSLIGTTADLYWQIAYLKQLIDLNKDSVTYARKTLELVDTRYSAGDASRLEMIQNQRNLISKEAGLTQNLQSLAEARHAFAILFNQAPGENPAERAGLDKTFTPQVRAGLPAEILHNRPDLFAAELRLRKVHKQIGITKAGYYPAINLSGDLGSSSMELREILQNPAATLGIGLALPFVNWNATRLNVEISEADYAEAVVNFRQTLYSALSEVEDALSARIHYQDEAEKRMASFSLALQAEELSAIRYRAGESRLQDWLDEQESRREAEQTLMENRLNQLKSAMQLFLALGGGYPDGLDEKTGMAADINYQ